MESDLPSPRLPASPTRPTRLTRPTRPNRNGHVAIGEREFPADVTRQNAKGIVARGRLPASHQPGDAMPPRNVLVTV